MLKCKVNKKELKENYYYIVSCSYCDTQYLLRRKAPRFYYNNIYGWRFDVYEVDNNFIITDGYEYLKTNKKQQTIDTIIKKYNDKARLILSKSDYKSINIKLNTNLNKCIKELKGVLNEI
jgi:hypothetical protein